MVQLGSRVEVVVRGWSHFETHCLHLIVPVLHHFPLGRNFELKAIKVESCDTPTDYPRHH